MEYKIDLGSWNSVFAVPSVLVDQHIKLAGAAQLKVILWFLRHAGEGLTAENIGKSLNMQEADVRDCLQYWVQMKVIAFNENIIEPEPGNNIEPGVYERPVNSVTQSKDTEAIAVKNDVEVEQSDNEKKDNSKKRALSRPEKPDIKYLGQRIASDDSIAFLMQSADEIFGRITSNNDKATLLLIHEYDGLPVEVIIMLLQYAFSIGKGNMRYIEKMAVSWADDEINTLEAAENKIRKLTSGRNAAVIVQRTIGQEEHSPTEKEIEYSDLWINQWKFDQEMIREAYERCIDAKGKYIAKYVSSVLERWYYSGIKTIEQAKSEKLVKKGSKKDKKGYSGTYDISEYESTSVVDEEW